MNGIALSPLTMIRLPFLLGFFLLLTGSAPFADAASSGQEQGDGGVVHIGIQETLDPEFFVDTLGPTAQTLSSSPISCRNLFNSGAVTGHPNEIHQLFHSRQRIIHLPSLYRTCRRFSDKAKPL